MITLEMRTVLLNYAISNAICLGIVFSLWRKHRHCSPAFDFWLGSFTLQFFSMLMFSLRGVVPEPIAILLGVPTSLIGVLLLHRGLCDYLGEAWPQRQNLFLVTALIGVHVFFLWVQPSLQIRGLNFTLGLLLLFGQISWLLLHRIALPLRANASILGWIMVAYCVVSLGRIFIALFVESPETFYASGQYLSWLFMVYQMLGIGMAFALLLLVNNRLLADLESDIAKRQQVEDELHALNAELKSQATTDQLTRIANRRYLTSVLDHEVERMKRYGGSLAIIILDIDHFKSINDRFGHPAGDSVLIGVGSILTGHIRSVDTAGRWGGEEFLVICPETDATGAAQLAELMRQLIEAKDFCLPDRVTASFGVAAARLGMTAEDLLKDADVALYQAKASNRNRVVVGTVSE